MREEKIVITLSGDGTLSAETKGFKGATCEKEVLEM